MSLPARIKEYSILPESAVRPRSGILSMLSGAERAGSWAMPRHLRIAAIMGSVELDLRQALIPEGVSTIEIFCLMGSVEIAAPPGVRVEFDGDALVGEFQLESDHTVEYSADAPTIRVVGTVLLGSVEGTIRYADESPRHARRRRKLARGR